MYNQTFYNPTYHDYFIQDFVFTPTMNVSLQTAETREKNWFINLCRRKYPQTKININNFNTEIQKLNIGNWKDQLKMWLAMPQQRGSILNPNASFSTRIVSQAELEDAMEAFYEATVYHTDDLVETVGFGNLYKAIQQGGYTTQNVVLNVPISKQATYNKMLNGIKTEYVQAMKRLDWAENQGLMVDYTMHSTMDPNIPTVATFDISFMPKVNNSTAGIPKRSFTTFAFEEKTNLDVFHMASFTDSFKQTLNPIYTIDDLVTCTVKHKMSNYVAQVIINGKKLDEYVQNLLAGRLKDLPVYESPRQLKLPSELIAEISDKEKKHLKIFLDGLKLLGQKIVNGQIQNTGRQSVKFHVWYGR